MVIKYDEKKERPAPPGWTRGEGAGKFEYLRLVLPSTQNGTIYLKSETPFRSTLQEL